jgi:hypothetical protein
MSCSCGNIESKKQYMNLNQAVFTTKYVIEDESPIVYVSHDSEGDWQFFGPEEEIQEDEARVVSLEAIIELSPYVKEILWMPEGVEAWYDTETREWTTSVPHAQSGK